MKLHHSYTVILRETLQHVFSHFFCTSTVGMFVDLQVMLEEHLFRTDAPSSIYEWQPCYSDGVL